LRGRGKDQKIGAFGGAYGVILAMLVPPKMKYMKRFSIFSNPGFIGVCLGVCWATCEAVDTTFKTDKRGFDDLHRCRKPL
jgi:hypothetical protein